MNIEEHEVMELTHKNDDLRRELIRLNNLSRSYYEQLNFLRKMGCTDNHPRVKECIGWITKFKEEIDNMKCLFAE
jgi:hypothetical protein